MPFQKVEYSFPDEAEESTLRSKLNHLVQRRLTCQAKLKPSLKQRQQNLKFVDDETMNMKLKLLTMLPHRTIEPMYHQRTLLKRSLKITLRKYVNALTSFSAQGT